MKFYIQTDSDHVVRDLITFEHPGYMPVELETPLPDSVLGGWYRLVGGALVFDQALYDAANHIPALQAAAEELEAVKAPARIVAEAVLAVEDVPVAEVEAAAVDLLGLIGVDENAPAVVRAALSTRIASATAGMEKTS